jgi:hypothetical protein
LYKDLSPLYFFANVDPLSAEAERLPNDPFFLNEDLIDSLCIGVGYPGHFGRVLDGVLLLVDEAQQYLAVLVRNIIVIRSLGHEVSSMYFSKGLFLMIKE